MIDRSVSDRARALAIPLSAYLELTYACNWRCVFCYNPRHRDLQRLASAEWIAVLDSLRRLGTLNITLTGGEPLAHPAFFEIAGAARERAFALRIFTNGSLIDDGVAGRIALLLPLGVELSLHGASAAVHDSATATPGSFAAMWNGVDRLRSRGVRVLLKSPVTAINEHELDAMVELCASRDVPLRLDATITPRDDGDPSPLRYTPSDAARRRVMSMAVAEGSVGRLNRQQGEENCGVGKMTIAVDPEGNVYPCMQWRHRALGNVRTEALHAMWTDSEERRQAVQTSIAANDAMRSLGRTATLPFCPALALQHTGSATTPDLQYLSNSAIADELLPET